MQVEKLLLRGKKAHKPIEDRFYEIVDHIHNAMDGMGYTFWEAVESLPREYRFFVKGVYHASEELQRAALEEWERTLEGYKNQTTSGKTRELLDSVLSSEDPENVINQIADNEVRIDVLGFYREMRSFL